MSRCVECNTIVLDKHICPDCAQAKLRENPELEQAVKVNVDDIWADEKKIGKCEVCGAKNVEVFASGFHVAFVCEKCLV